MHQLGYSVLHNTPGIWQWEKLRKQAALPPARADSHGKICPRAEGTFGQYRAADEFPAQTRPREH
jgi:hypothetical protein